jgi:hypothetical protein
MLSSVFVSGRLGEIIGPKTRFVEVDRTIPGSSGRYEVDKFIVRSMLCVDGPFMKLPCGTFIVLRGRLEQDPKHGLIIVDEVDELFSMPKEMKRI